MKRLLLLGLGALSLAAASAANAGGALGMCDPGTGAAPLKYAGAGSVVLNYDQGSLGTRTNAQAAALVDQSIALWTNVPTASVTLSRGAALPVDVTTANYATYFDVYDDNINPVIFDTDGSIIDQKFGVGQKSHILGFAGSAYYLAPTCRYAEGQAVINGYINVSDATFVTTIAHEIGHLIGMDHTQLDGAQGLSTSNYPLMYPVAYRTLQSLHEDDIAAVSALYPDSTFNSVYGSVSGNLTLANGAGALQGGNVWANEINTGKVYSTVSDYLGLSNGGFKLSLPAGTYQLHVEAIDTTFTSGSGVGPFTRDLSKASFQPPFYSLANGGGSPMAAVTLGNSSPITFRIKAGCSATAVFNINGTGSVLGCGGTALTDLGGDGKSDLLYRNFATGQVYRIFMNGFSITSAALAYTEPNLAWHVVADADFNGDGVTDLLWRNDASGQLYMQLYNSSGVPTSGAVFWIEPNPAWKIVATPDFDGDGNADILWWNSVTGQVYAMQMAGPLVLASGNFYTEPNTQWQIVGVGDFAGSGKRNQLVWRNIVTGQVYLMTVTASGGTFSQSGQLIYTEPNLAWKIVGVGDFNGDGKSDLLYRNDATGQVYMFLMNGPSIAGGGMVYSEANLAWKIISVGDYNGDGKADILYRNFATGQVYELQMNGLSVSGAGLVYSEGNLNWHALGPYEYAQ